MPPSAATSYSASTVLIGTATAVAGHGGRRCKEHEVKYIKMIIGLATACAAPAFAAGGVVAAGEIGYVPHEQPSTASRAAVMAEVQAQKRAPVTADGWRFVGGELGWVYVGVQGVSPRAAEQRVAERGDRQLEAASSYRVVNGEVGWVEVPYDAPTGLAAVQGRALRK